MVSLVMAKYFCKNKYSNILKSISYDYFIKNIVFDSDLFTSPDSLGKQIYKNILVSLLKKCNIQENNVSFKWNMKNRLLQQLTTEKNCRFKDQKAVDLKVDIFKSHKRRAAVLFSVVFSVKFRKHITFVFVTRGYCCTLRAVTLPQLGLRSRSRRLHHNHSYT